MGAVGQASTPHPTTGRPNRRAEGPPERGGPSPASEVVYGRRPVLEVLRAGRPVERLYVAEGARGLSELVALARQQGIPVHRVPREKLTRLCGGAAHQGTACQMAAVRYTPFDELVERLKEAGPTGRVLVVDHVVDPHNLGSLLRSAEAAGVAGAVVASRRAAGLTGAVWKASAGALAHLPVARVASVAAAVDALKGEGFWTVGADPGAASSLWEVDLAGRVAFVVGAEGPGLSPLVRRRCDMLVRIPMLGRVGSLNAGVAGALLMFEAVRQSLVAPGFSGHRGTERVKTGANPRPDRIS